MIQCGGINFGLGNKIFILWKSLGQEQLFMKIQSNLPLCERLFQQNKNHLIHSVVRHLTAVALCWQQLMTRNMSTDFRQQTISLFSVTGSHWILTVQCLVSADPVSWCTRLAVQPPRTSKCRARAELDCRPVNRPVNKLLILMEEL